METDGFAVFPATEESIRWARAADALACRVAADPTAQAKHLRHGRTWFVGVDALPTGPQGDVSGIPLCGVWRAYVPHIPIWHPAQLSIIYPGYPRQDPDQSDANHRFRLQRDAAHVDGLLPVGRERRRYVSEFHAFILGLPLNASLAAPTVCWRGSHRIMARALRQALLVGDPREVDVTDIYTQARREAFDTCERVELRAAPGEAFLVHRFALHGTAPWGEADDAPRRIAFFRPEFATLREWLEAP